VCCKAPGLARFAAAARACSRRVLTISDPSVTYQLRHAAQHQAVNMPRTLVTDNNGFPRNRSSLPLSLLPARAMNVPRAQGVHASIPNSGLYDPGAQAIHLATPALASLSPPPPPPSVAADVPAAPPAPAVYPAMQRQASTEEAPRPAPGAAREVLE
jgi:hypothetical protein